MKTSVKILLGLAIFLVILSGLTYALYRSFPNIRNGIARFLASHASEKDLEKAYEEFLRSCEAATEKTLAEKGPIDPAMSAKLHSYCLCAQGEFKKRFTPQEIMAIGLEQMTSTKEPNIDPDKIQEIVKVCLPAMDK